MSGVRTATLTAAIVLAATVATVPLAAQEPATTPTEASATPRPPADEGGYLPETAENAASISVLDIAGKLLVALAVAWGAVKAVRWWHDSRLRSVGDEGRGGRRMWLEETLRLGPDAQLYLVEVEGRRMLLCSGESGVVEVADVSKREASPTLYRSVRKRSDGSTDELRVAGAGISTHAVRPDVVEDSESWEQRRGRLLRELQEQE
jgi:hypothetical protein